MENKNKKSLNDILEDYQKIENELISNDGEVSESLEEKLNLHEKELGEKLDGYEHFVRYLKSKIEYLKNMEGHFSKRRKVLENSIKRCKNSMTSSLLITGKSKIQTNDFNFTLGKSQKWSVDIDLLNDIVFILIPPSTPIIISLSPRIETMFFILLRVPGIKDCPP